MLASCLMVTRGRPELARLAVECWRSQTWADKELVIVDDEDNPSFDAPPRGRVVYARLGRRKRIGAKRNRAAELATGDVFFTWDDDDWHAETRLSRQIAAMVHERAGLVCDRECYYTDGKRAWRRTVGRIGSTFAFPRATWERAKFSDLQSGEDDHFYARARRVCVLSDEIRTVARLHGSNTVSRIPEQWPGWYEVDFCELPQGFRRTLAPER